MAFNYPNCTDMVCLMQYNNSITNYTFGSGILIAVFAMVFITLLAFGGPRKAFVASSWFTFLVSIPMAAMNVINSAYPIVLIALGCISLIPLFLTDR